MACPNCDTQLIQNGSCIKWVNAVEQERNYPGAVYWCSYKGKLVNFLQSVNCVIQQLLFVSTDIFYTCFFYVGLKPIEIESEFPENFTVFTSSQNDQSSSGLPKAKHGIFSYLLMKGLEGKADADKDGKITNGELFAYLESNVKEKAISIWGREQDPSFFGKKTKVLSTYWWKNF